jgi:hypothetical protein
VSLAIREKLGLTFILAESLITSKNKKAKIKVRKPTTY